MSLNIEPVSSVDSAWLSMEAPNNLMMVSGVMTSNKPIEMKKLREVIRCRFLTYKRFRQRVVRPQIPFAPANWTPSFWETDPDFDLDRHLHEVHLDPPANRRVLREFVSKLMSTPLDFDRSPWEMHLVHGFNGGSVLVARVHHCVGDGIGLMHVILSMTEDSPDAPPPQPDRVEDEGARTSMLEEALDAVFQHATAAASAVLKLYGKVLHEAMEAISHPGKAVDFAQQTGTEGAQTIRRLLLRADDPKTMFKGKLDTAKLCAWSTPIDLNQVKDVKKALGGTVNDVLISAVAGGLRRYIVDHGGEINGLNFRAAIPVNLRRPEDLGKLGNKFGLVFLSLPIGIENHLDRLKEVRRRMNRLKGSKEAPLFFGLLKSLGYTPPELQAPIVSALADKITAVMSNVPGPAKPLYLAGEEIDNIMFWVPQAGRVGLGISILSYNNKVLIGVNTDAGLVPNPEHIVDGFYKEFEALVKLAAEAPEQAAPVPEPEKDAPEKCQALTKRGTPCSNKPTAGSPYCRLHQRQMAAAE